MRVTLVRAKAVSDFIDAGRIGASAAIGCGDGTALQIVELQPEGKRPMSLDAFRNGHRWDAGMRLRSLL
jgi:methionyl-tRNA formyltransferase